MALTIGNVLTRTRDYISDSVVTYRNTDVKLFRYADDGQRKILSKHPEAAYSDEDTSISTTGPDEIIALTASGDSLAIRDSFADALSHFIAAKVFGEDSEDIANQNLASYHNDKFREDM